MQNRKPTHPGEVLYEDVILPLNMTITCAAQTLGISRKTLSKLIHGKSSLTTEIAVRISQATGTNPENWMNMQVKLDLWNIALTKNLQVQKFGGEGSA